MNENAVSDSACLIALAKIGHLDLLFKSFGTVTIPPAVHREFGQNIDPLVVQSVQNTALVRSLKTQIDEGESEAIALAMEQADVFVVLNDKKGTSYCETTWTQSYWHSWFALTRQEEGHSFRNQANAGRASTGRF
jgi:predicted nucleic acid-binding protein